jgi:hypothetical protein
MATLPLDLRLANPMHALAAAPAAAAAPANDNARCWTRDRRARVLLASIAAHPPARLLPERVEGNPFDAGCAFAGFRAEALEAIRAEYGDAWCQQPTATQAIDVVLGNC